MNKLADTISEKITEDRLYHERAIKRLHATTAFVNGPLAAWETDVEYNVSVSTNWIDFNFPKDLPSTRQSAELRNFVMATGIKLTKTFSPSSKSFSASGMWRANDDKLVYIAFRNHMPASCTLVEEEITVPEHTEKRMKAICGNADDEAAIEPPTPIPDEIPAGDDAPAERAYVVPKSTLA